MTAIAAAPVLAIDIDRWARPATTAELALVAEVAEPVLDIGCGPGRLTAALAQRGRAVLGIDTAEGAVAVTRQRGGPAQHRSVFTEDAADGTWSAVLLVDGNIGIGGDPVRLLQRVCGLLAPGGVALVEVEGVGATSWTGSVVLHHGPVNLGEHDWAGVGIADIEDIAAEAGMFVSGVRHAESRWFVHLQPTFER